MASKQKPVPGNESVEAPPSPAGKPWPADRVERWPIGRLVPYARNPRTHSEAQIDQIAGSLREWGWTNPVLVDGDGTLIAGHARLEAARKLGLAEVPVMVAAGWSEGQRRAYVIADNKLALNGGWDDDLLSIELGDLGEIGFDLDLTGFSAGEIDALSGGEVPSLDTLAEAHGEPAEDGFWPTVKLRVPPDVKQRFDDLMADLGEGEEWQRFDRLVALAGPQLDTENP